MRLLITVNADLDVTVEFRTSHIELAAIERVVGTVSQQQRVMGDITFCRGILRLRTTGVQLLNVEDAAFANTNLLELVVILPNGSIETAVLNSDTVDRGAVSIFKSEIGVVLHIEIEIGSLFDLQIKAVVGALGIQNDIRICANFDNTVNL